MKKIYMILVIFLALGISISAVSAEEGFSWSFASSSDGTDISVNNNEVKIQGFSFTLPEGYIENTNQQVSGEKAPENFEGFKIASLTFEKDTSTIVIKVIYGDEDITDDMYTPGENATAKEIAGQKGYITNQGEYLSFSYVENGKFVQIDAPTEQDITSIIESSK